MGDKTIKLAIFVAGLAIGSIATWSALKTKYEQIANEEIESVKRVYDGYKNQMKENTKQPATTSVENEVTVNRDLVDYSKLVTNLGYAKDADKTNNKNGGKSMNDKPYVIPPEEFGEKDGYETITLAYYADEILANEMTDEVIEDIDNTVGYDSLDHFGEYEDDSVFVRDDEKKIDYEILRDTRNYSDVVPSCYE